MTAPRLAALPMPLTWALPPPGHEGSDPPSMSGDGSAWVSGDGPRWAGSDGEAALTMRAPGHSDLFADPRGRPSVDNAPRLMGAPPGGDFQFAARVRVGFGGTFDAGALVVWAGERAWAKVCFEQSPQGVPLAVSVVTRGLSDDANGFPVHGEHLWLRISRVGSAWAFHARAEGDFWHFVRHFHLDGPEPVTVGFAAQSPVGDGCEVSFEMISFKAATLRDLRGGE